MKKPNVYTRGGDGGLTSLVEGTRVPKSDQRLHAYGTVDELNSVVGLLHSKLLKQARRKPRLLKTVMIDLDWIQNTLFALGSHLATQDDNYRTQLPQIPKECEQILETRMDAMSERLPPLKNFVLPGTDELSALSHMARTICRRCERWVVALKMAESNLDGLYIILLNRLSDYFFVLARYLQVVVEKKKERVWRQSVE